MLPVNRCKFHPSTRIHENETQLDIQTTKVIRNVDIEEEKSDNFYEVLSAERSRLTNKCVELEKKFNGLLVSFCQDYTFYYFFRD